MFFWNKSIITCLAFAVSLGLFWGCSPKTAQKDTSTHPGPSSSVNKPAPPTAAQDSAARVELQNRRLAAKQQKLANTATPQSKKTAGQVQQAKSEPKRENLIPNGSFEKWPENNRLPYPWTCGYGYRDPDEAPSQGSRYTGKAPDGVRALQQTWKRPDGLDSCFKQFHITIDGLKPRTGYQVDLQAMTSVKGRIVVTPIAVTPGEGVIRKGLANLKKGMITLQPGEGFQQYTGYFQTQENTSVCLASACVEADAYPATVVWDDWQLIELGPAK